MKGSLLASHLPPLFRGGGGGVIFPRVGRNRKPGELRSQATQAGPTSPSPAPQELIPSARYLPPFSEGPAVQSSGLSFPVCAVGVAGLVWGWVKCL